MAACGQSSIILWRLVIIVESSISQFTWQSTQSDDLLSVFLYNEWKARTDPLCFGTYLSGTNRELSGP